MFRFGNNSTAIAAPSASAIKLSGSEVAVDEDACGVESGPAWALTQQWPGVSGAGKFLGFESRARRTSLIGLPQTLKEEKACVVMKEFGWRFPGVLLFFSSLWDPVIPSAGAQDSWAGARDSWTAFDPLGLNVPGLFSAA